MTINFCKLWIACMLAVAIHILAAALAHAQDVEAIPLPPDASPAEIAAGGMLMACVDRHYAGDDIGAYIEPCKDEIITFGAFCMNRYHSENACALAIISFIVVAEKRVLSL